MSEHDDGERRHLAELEIVAVSAEGTEHGVPNLFACLRQGPDDDQPLIHLDYEEDLIARLRPAEAAELGAKLIELARLAGEP